MPDAAVERRMVNHFRNERFEDALKYGNELCLRKPDEYQPFSVRCFIHLELGNMERIRKVRRVKNRN